MTTLSAPPLERARANAHRSAVRSDIAAVVEELQAVLGQALLALIVGRTVRTVARWTAAAPSHPAARDEQRLRDVLQVQRLLLTAERPEVVRAWFLGMNPQLGDAAPAEALAEGRARETMAAARAFVNAD